MFPRLDGLVTITIENQRAKNLNMAEPKRKTKIVQLNFNLYVYLLIRKHIRSVRVYIIIHVLLYIRIFRRENSSPIENNLRK